MAVAVPVWAWRAGVVFAVLVGAFALLRLSRPAGRWGRTIRRRLVLGVPWGTLLVVGFVLCVYLFLQGGWDHWYNPVVIPFRAWSYLAPLGVAVSGFAHSGSGHLLGNLCGTLAVAPLVEYADLDGALLLAEDPYEGVPIADGRFDLRAVDRGTGVSRPG